SNSSRRREEIHQEAVLAGERAGLERDVAKDAGDDRGGQVHDPYIDVGPARVAWGRSLSEEFRDTERAVRDPLGRSPWTGSSRARTTDRPSFTPARRPRRTTSRPWPA